MEIYFNILQPPARHHNCLGICIYSNIAMFPMNITSHIIMWVLGLVHREPQLAAPFAERLATEPRHSKAKVGAIKP
jgi:hypothetical protein